MSVPLPGYTSQRPLYPAVRRINVVGGMHDTLVNLVEVALGHFEADMKEADDPAAFVKSVCKSLGINTSLGVKWNDLRGHVHRLAIVQVIGTADEFVRELTQEYRYFREIENRPLLNHVQGKQLDALAMLIENLPDNEKRRAQECPEFALWQYFRMVRNRVVHGDRSEVTDRKLAAEHARLLKDHGLHFKRCYDWQPSAFGQIVYKDFFMFTRAVKYYAKILNDVCDLRPEDIVTRRLADDVEFLELVRRHKHLNGSRWAARRLARQYVMSDDQMQRAKNTLDTFMDDDPPAKVRRRMAKKASLQQNRGNPR